MKAPRKCAISKVEGYSLLEPDPLFTRKLVRIDVVSMCSIYES